MRRSWATSTSEGLELGSALSVDWRARSKCQVCIMRLRPLARFPAVRFLAIAILITTACTDHTGPTGPQDARLSVPFQLFVGESAEIRSEPLQIGFRQVTEDSRCPAAPNASGRGRSW